MEQREPAEKKGKMVLMRIQPFISIARTKSLWTEGNLSFISSSTMAYSIQQLPENLHNRFYNYYNFKDLY